MHKRLPALAWETNRYAYNRIWKMVLEHAGDIHCSYCPYHENENWSRRPTRSWKEYRRTQYKTKDVPVE